MSPKDRYDSPSPDRRHDEERILTPTRPLPPRPEPSVFDRIHAAATRAAVEAEATRAELADVRDAMNTLSKHAEDAAKNSASAARRAGRAEDGIAKLLPHDDGSLPPMRAPAQTHNDGEWHTQTSRNEIVNEKIAQALEKQRVAEADKEEAERKRAEERSSDRRWALIVAIIVAALAVVERIIETAAKGHL